MRKPLIVTAVAMSLFIDLAACSKDQSATKAARVDALFAQWDKPDSPGCSLGISQNGKIVYEHAYGMANLELGVPITPASVFHVASIAKQFTAMSILLLSQRGQLSLDDDIRKYVPEFSDYGTRLTIRHVLSHTSGLRDAFVLRNLAGPREGADPMERLVQLLAHQRSLNSVPGAAYEYNNGGYTLLGYIVKRVSGQSLAAFDDANIFKPLDMTQTHLHDDPTRIVPNRASGYYRDANGLHLAVHLDLGHIVGNSGLFTTARDLLVWEQNFAAVRVGDPKLITVMQTPTVLTSGEASPYGLGLQIGQHRGLRTVGHGGGDPGYGAYVVRYPDQDFAVAVLCNLEDIGAAVGGLTESVADIYLTDTFPAASPGNATAPPPSVTLSAEQLASKAGLYRDPSTESFGRVVVRDSKLVAITGAGEGQSIELTPASADRFVIPGTSISIEFVAAAAGRPQEIHVIGAGPKPTVMQKVDTSFAPTNAELRVFAGEYNSPELDVTYKLTVRDSGLVLQMPGRTDIALKPIVVDTFQGATVDVIKFSRDARGVVTGFTVHSSGVHGLRFERVTQSVFQ